MNTRVILMIRNPRHVLVPIATAALVAGAAPRAEEHTAAALKHATEAAASQDSIAVGEHTDQALKHIEAAKAAHPADPGKIEHLQKGEAALDAAQRHSDWFNTNSAVEHAHEGKEHLEAAGP